MLLLANHLVNCHTQEKHGSSGLKCTDASLIQAMSALLPARGKYIYFLSYPYLEVHSEQIKSSMKSSQGTFTIEYCFLLYPKTENTKGPSWPGCTCFSGLVHNASCHDTPSAFHKDFGNNGPTCWLCRLSLSLKTSVIMIQKFERFEALPTGKIQLLCMHAAHPKKFGLRCISKLS